MKLKRIDALLFQMLILSLAGIVVTRVAGLFSLSSVLFTLTFPLTVALWIRCVRNEFAVTDWLMIAAAALAVINVLIDLVLSGGSFSFSYMKKVIMFIMTLMFLQTCHKMWVGKRIGLLVHRVVDVLTIFLIVMHIFFRDQMHMLNGVQTKYVAFNFSNPNLTAIFLTCMYMLEFIRAVSVPGRNEKIFHGVLTAAQAFFVLDTTSRNGLLVMVLFTAMALGVIFRRKIESKLHCQLELRIGKPLAVGIAVFPALFAVLYMALINSNWVQVVFGFLVSEGKELDSRVKEWQPALDAIWRSPLIGSYYGISDGTGTGHMHNTHMDIAASYGVPVLVLVCILLVIYIFQSGKCYKQQTEFLYMVGFCCALMLGIFESVMFSGGLGVYIFLGIFLLMTGPREIQKKEQIEEYESE